MRTDTKPTYIQSLRPCPRCLVEGTVEDSSSNFFKDRVQCLSCKLEFNNRPRPVFTPTGIEYLDRYLDVMGGEYGGEGLLSNGFNMDAYEGFVLRHEWVSEYAWAVPSPRALDEIARHGPIVEIGAGGGYWAMLLRERGVDVRAYDSRPEGNHWVKKVWAEVKVGGPEKARIKGDHTLFLCWPPYSRPMAARCLEAYGGDTLIYIGEAEGGCTGCAVFHRTLEEEWREEKVIAIPQWPGIHDYLHIYRRR